MYEINAWISTMCVYTFTHTLRTQEESEEQSESRPVLGVQMAVVIVRAGWSRQDSKRKQSHCWARRDERQDFDNQARGENHQGRVRTGDTRQHHVILLGCAHWFCVWSVSFPSNLFSLVSPPHKHHRLCFALSQKPSLGIATMFYVCCSASASY